MDVRAVRPDGVERCEVGDIKALLGTIMPTSALCRPSVKGVVGPGDCRLRVGKTISL